VVMQVQSHLMNSVPEYKDAALLIENSRDMTAMDSTAEVSPYMLK